MVLFRLKGARVVWTAHNLLPHRRSALPAIDVLGRHLVIALADLILVHGSGAASVLVTRFPRAESKVCCTIRELHRLLRRNEYSKQCAG